MSHRTSERNCKYQCFHELDHSQQENCKAACTMRPTDDSESAILPILTGAASTASESAAGLSTTWGMVYPPERAARANPQSTRQRSQRINEGAMTRILSCCASMSVTTRRSCRGSGKYQVCANVNECFNSASSPSCASQSARHRGVIHPLFASKTSAR